MVALTSTQAAGVESQLAPRVRPPTRLLIFWGPMNGVIWSMYPASRCAHLFLDPLPPSSKSTFFVTSSILTPRNAFDVHKSQTYPDIPVYTRWAHCFHGRPYVLPERIVSISNTRFCWRTSLHTSGVGFTHRGPHDTFPPGYHQQRLRSPETEALGRGPS